MDSQDCGDDSFLNIPDLAKAAVQCYCLGRTKGDLP